MFGRTGGLIAARIIPHLLDVGICAWSNIPGGEACASVTEDYNTRKI